MTGGCAPAAVEREFRRYLECGILAHGFARARCADCGHDFLIAYSCKGRDICPLTFIFWILDVDAEPDTAERNHPRKCAIASARPRGGDERVIRHARPAGYGPGDPPYSSAELKGVFAVRLAPPAPPTTRTLPSGSNVAVCSARYAVIAEVTGWNGNVAWAGS